MTDQHATSNPSQPSDGAASGGQAEVKRVAVREPTRDASYWDIFVERDHKRAPARREIRFHDARFPERQLRASRYSVGMLHEYARRMAGSLDPSPYSVEWLLATMAEISAVQSPVPATTIIVGAISPDRWADWAKVLLRAFRSSGCLRLSRVDRGRLAELHAAFVRMLPAGDATGTA